MAGSQDYTPDPRNEAALVYLNGELVRRENALVSIFDAGFALGDGVWEGIRLHHGVLVFLEAHIARLFAGATAIALDIGMTPSELAHAIYRLVDANAMTDGVHVRVMITRGRKATVNQDPRNALGRPTVAITAEYKRPSPEIASRGLALRTSAIRCSPAHMFDMRLNSHSRLNLIRALLDAVQAGGDEALMLDPDGAVSSCNATNFFCVSDGTVLTSDGRYCFNGITRGHIVELCRANGIPIEVRPFPLTLAHGAAEAFVTGTMGGVTPVRDIDHRRIRAVPGPITSRLRELYHRLTEDQAARGRA